MVLRTSGPSGEHETVTVAASSRPLFSRDDSLAVLVNENSASSAEILAGALHDNGRARLFGPSRTFGKGKIQSVFQLDDGSAVFVTVAKYQTPKGHNIDGAGVLPDKVCGQPLHMAGGSGSGGGGRAARGVLGAGNADGGHPKRPVRSRSRDGSAGKEQAGVREGRE